MLGLELLKPCHLLSRTLPIAADWVIRNNEGETEEERGKQVGDSEPMKSQLERVERGRNGELPQLLQGTVRVSVDESGKNNSTAINGAAIDGRQQRGFKWLFSSCQVLHCLDRQKQQRTVIFKVFLEIRVVPVQMWFAVMSWRRSDARSSSATVATTRCGQHIGRTASAHGSNEKRRAFQS